VQGTVPPRGVREVGDVAEVAGQRQQRPDDLPQERATDPDRGTGACICGALLSASSYLMKSPPEQREDTEGRARLEAFIAGTEPR
jgi:myo-inositol-1-phosphate synthase